MDIYSTHGKKEIIKRFIPRTRLAKNMFLSFFFGGLICLSGELLRRLFLYLGASADTSLSLVSITLIIFSSVLTALGIFDKLAKHAGAGTLVPITGFSNAVTSPAIDAKSEGYVLGVGAKIFTVAGPVILYGISAGALYGVIYYLTMLFI